MSAWLVLTAIVTTSLSGVPGLFFPSRSRTGEWLSAGLLALGCTIGLCGTLLSLEPGVTAELQWVWPVPGGLFDVRIDGLSAVFLVPIFVISLLGSTFALGYWAHAEHASSGRKLRLFWGGLTAALALVVTAHNTVLFLFSWELMTLLNFLALTVEDLDAEVRRAGFLYLTTCHVATLALFAVFALLHAMTQGWGWTALDAPSAVGLTTALFALALFGFGTKAGIVPFHFWLPSAHARAPTHLSALMSGVVIKMGIYGLLRLTSLVAQPPLWWGEVVLGFGAISGVLGVALALGQHDLKRLLAYHSVENIGIILLGIGVALLGRSMGASALVVLGLAGALFHVWNHGIFKSLLFLSAGAVIRSTGTREIDRLGGLARRMPKTALLFLVGAVAICGLPPLNGFVSEFLVYVGLFKLAMLPIQQCWLVGAFAAPALTLVGALAMACFAKAFGAVFMGQGRSEATVKAQEPGKAMLWPMSLLAGFCVLLGVGPMLMVPLLQRAIAVWAPEVRALPLVEVAPLEALTLGNVALLAVSATLGVWLLARTRRDLPGLIETWSCGYAVGTPRMQYTASSFADSLVGLFRWALRPRVHAPVLVAAFPGSSEFHSDTPDVVLDNVVAPTVETAGTLFAQLRWFHSGNINAYLFYVLLALLVLLIWR